MSEIDRILDAAEDWHGRGTDFALATVVGVRGSTYRGLGARQLIAADGTGVGTVSGGCLDQDLQLVANDVIAEGRARLVEFDLTADDEAIWGWGIGCNGATELIVEPAQGGLELARTVRSVTRPFALVHHLGERVGQRTVLRRGENGPIGAEVDRAITEGWSRTIEVEGEQLMVEVIGAPRRLIVCGAGHDAAPLVRFGAQLGYEPIVVDDRRPFLSRERFPETSQLVHTSPRELDSALDLDESAAVVIMSHNYLRDLDYLEACLGHNLRYIGVLGPGERLQRLLDDLAERGVEPTRSDLASLHGPAGLDIGSEGPTEIAWAVLSEIMAVRRGAHGGPLRDRKGPDLIRHYDRPH